MTRKVYKSAMGKTVDLGALLLQNEQVRAVGNMGVNAAGDLIDSGNNIIDRRNRQVQRQYQRQTNVSDHVVPSGTLNARRAKQQQSETTVEETQPETVAESDLSEIFDQEPTQSAQQQETNNFPSSGGLAAAIARKREVKQELEKTLRQRRQEQGMKKI